MFSCNHDGGVVVSMIAGCLTGATQTAVFYPLEVIKSRQQVAHYAGKSMYRSLWQGVGLSTALTMVKRGLTVATYDFADRALIALEHRYFCTNGHKMSVHLSSPAGVADPVEQGGGASTAAEYTPSPVLQNARNVLSGAGAGFAEAVMIQPFNVLRLRVQTEPDVGAATYRGVLRHLLRTEQSTALYNGFTPTVLQNCLWWTTCPLLYRRAQGAILQWEADVLRRRRDSAAAAGVLPPPSAVSDGILSSYQRNALAGVASSTVTTLATLPLNRVTVLMYSHGAVSLRAAFAVCWQQGVMSFFRGWLPSFVRLTLSGALMMPLYDLYTPPAYRVAVATGIVREDVSAAAT
eukprot:TRINITY_DN12088_c0_g1_i1.p1 TRINITY_DN12088_c0_g1~~TRINITY_DN12088_c0_g1_i1.p1  ORF type:complete len:349 (+),score=62.44 TRINITY_DN12088_c0_g1_i1:184-1230(+)